MRRVLGLLLTGRKNRTSEDLSYNMPTSTRLNNKRPARVRHATQKALDSSPPGGPSAKRRKTNGTSKRLPRAVTPDSDSDGGESIETTSAAEVQDLAELIIPRLAVAKEPVDVAYECSNEKFVEKGSDDIRAYAKVCGRDWTYYIQEPVVKIGRAPEPGRHSMSNGMQSSPIPKKTSPMNIDLGPSKMVSREHAEFSFDGENDQWVVTVLGRNGVKWNDTLLRQGHRKPVSCGDVLEIAGTQMMFVTANEQANIHPSIMALLDRPDVSDEEVKVNHGFQGLPTTNITQSSSSQKPAVSSDSMNGQAYAPPPSSDFLRPNTPLRPKKIAPSSSATQPYSNARSFSLGRGHSLTSSEAIDYNQIAYKDLKPPFSYACLIARAIFSTEEQAITLADLYAWIRGNFSYFRNFDPDWDPALGDSKLPKDLLKRLNTMQNSVRHNLSVHDLFTKVPRRSDEPGKGMKWRIAEDKLEEAYKLVEKQSTKGGSSKRRSRSNPSSPVAHGGYATTNPSMLQTSSISRMTPPRSVPLDAESQTPTHRPNQHAHPSLPRLLADEPSLPHPHFSSEASPLPQTNRRRRTLTTSGAPGGSSPTLTSGAWGGFNSADNPSSLFTPAPRKHNLNSNLHPGTAKLPTSHMADSSPAPFWKFVGQTPGDVGNGGLPLIFGSSPVKGGGGDPGAAVKRSDSSSSSPPLPISPSANRNGTGTGSFANRVENATVVRSNGRESLGASEGAAPNLDDTIRDDEEEEGLEGGIDLMKYVFARERELRHVFLLIDLIRGFQSIGRFHGQSHLATSSHAASVPAP